jgi:hypothetical protein
MFIFLFGTYSLKVKFKEMRTILITTIDNTKLITWIWMAMEIMVDFQINQRLTNVKKKVVRVDKRITIVNLNKMCSSAIMYLDEDEFLKEQGDNTFYKKESDTWDYYSGLPNPKAYEE